MTHTDHITLRSTAVADSQQKNPEVYLHDCQLIICICIYTSCNLSHPSVFLSSRTLLRTFITSCKTLIKGMFFTYSLTSLKLREDIGLAISILWTRYFTLDLTIVLVVLRSWGNMVESPVAFTLVASAREPRRLSTSLWDALFWDAFLENSSFAWMGNRKLVLMKDCHERF